MLNFENSYTGIVCGLDEAGRGPLAGPVMAGCVYIPEDKLDLDFWDVVTDSKKLSAKKRAMLYPLIKEHTCYGIAQASTDEIDSINIHHASLLAMKRAYEAMIANFDIKPDHALIDGKFTPDIACEATAIIKGDNLSLSIAAASILAKVERDMLMAELHQEHPAYNWIRNAGYGTKEHINAINKHGATKNHRRSFAPVKAVL